jgi:hypothetical protein
MELSDRFHGSADLSSEKSPSWIGGWEGSRSRMDATQKPHMEKVTKIRASQFRVTKYWIQTRGLALRSVIKDMANKTKLLAAFSLTPYNILRYEEKAVTKEFVLLKCHQARC